jgi:hypothetical protein
MSYHAQDFQHPEHPAWYQRKALWIIAGVLVCLLAAGVGFLTYTGVRNIPDIGGSMTFEGDPDTRIYIGDKLVGTTQVTVTWAQLLGNENQEPLAIELSSADTVTAELISGPGAKILERRNHATGHTPWMDDREDSYLIRRADGALDHVYIWLIELTKTNHPRRLVILMRARKGTAGSTISFDRSGGSGSHHSSPSFVKAFGKPPEEFVDFWHLSRYSPPDELEEEAKKKGYWEPDAP